MDVLVFFYIIFAILFSINIFPIPKLSKTLKPFFVTFFFLPAFSKHGNQFISEIHQPTDGADMTFILQLECFVCFYTRFSLFYLIKGIS